MKAWQQSNLQRLMAEVGSWQKQETRKGIDPIAGTLDFLDNDSYLVFRTRTRIDDDGNLTSAHYGKILGRWISGAANMLLSDGCFNPKENDVSLEDSRTLRNVLRNMK